MKRFVLFRLAIIVGLFMATAMPSDAAVSYARYFTDSGADPVGPPNVYEGIKEWLDKAAAACSSANPVKVRIAVYNIHGSASDNDAVEDIANNHMPSCLNIRVISGGGATRQRAARLALGVDDVDPKGADAMRHCPSSCFDTAGSIMHDKFMLISDTSTSAGDQPAFMQMSANWTDGHLRTGSQYNDGLVIAQESGVYNRVDTYFERLWGCASATPALDDPNCAGVQPPSDYSATDLSVQFFPKPASQDPLPDQITSTGCSWSSTSDVIRVAMGHWADGRGNKLAELLYQKRQEGCDLKVMMTNGARIWDQSFSTHWVRKILDANDMRCTYGLKHVGSIHSKYLLTRGTSGNVRVFTGSHNFNGSALTENDEIWVKRQDHFALFGDYMANFDSIYNDPNRAKKAYCTEDH